MAERDELCGDGDVDASCRACRRHTEGGSRGAEDGGEVRGHGGGHHSGEREWRYATRCLSLVELRLHFVQRGDVPGAAPGDHGDITALEPRLGKRD